MIMINQTVSFSTLHKELQRKLPFYVTFSLLDSINLNQEDSIKYLRIIIDAKLSWKIQLSYIANIAKKVKRNIGLLSKLRTLLCEFRYSG